MIGLIAAAAVIRAWTCTRRWQCRTEVSLRSLFIMHASLAILG